MFNNTTCSSPDNFTILCSSLDGSEREYNSRSYVRFASYIIIAILSPVAVIENGLILAAIWKKTFQRTPFHILLSGLAFTDLCTGLIAQPFTSAFCLLYFLNPTLFIARPVLVVTILTIGVLSAVYFGVITLLLMTLMSIERWLHMSRQSMVTSRRGCITVALVLLIPIPFAVLTAVSIINGTGDHGSWVNIIIAAGILFCYLTTLVTYCKVFRIIRQHQQQVQGNQSSQNFGQPAINLAKYNKSVTTILYILALFSCCFLPVFICLVASVLVGYTFEIYTALGVSSALLFLSSYLNPVLYLWRMNDIRNGVKQLFCTHG